MIVYKVTNLLNRKIYIGKDTKNNPNYLGSGLLITAAIQKYGRQNFVKETLQVCSSVEELNCAEIAWIEKLDATNKNTGYNLAKGGDGGKTRPVVWNKGLTKATDVRVSLYGQAGGKTRKGSVQSTETCNKRREALLGRKREPEVGRRISEQKRGKPVPDERKLRISETLKKKYPKELVSVTCLSCGELFEKSASREKSRIQANRRGPFCSRSCTGRGTARKNNVELKCAGCGKLFLRLAGRETQRIKHGMRGPFCSRKCVNT